MGEVGQKAAVREIAQKKNARVGRAFADQCLADSVTNRRSTRRNSAFAAPATLRYGESVRMLRTCLTTVMTLACDRRLIFILGVI
jgi:hypothetical protein